MISPLIFIFLEYAHASKTELILYEPVPRNVTVDADQRGPWALLYVGHYRATRKAEVSGLTSIESSVSSMISIFYKSIAIHAYHILYLSLGFIRSFQGHMTGIAGVSHHLEE